MTANNTLKKFKKSVKVLFCVINCSQDLLEIKGPGSLTYLSDIMEFPKYVS